MNQETSSTASRVTRWGNVAQIAATVIALTALILGGGWFWSEVWNVPRVVYTILPTYELEDQAFCGLVVENLGRSTAHGVFIQVRNLETAIQRMRVNSDEASKVEGGEGTNNATISLDRLTAGSSVTVYFLIPKSVSLGTETLSIPSEEGKAYPDHRPSGVDVFILELLLVVGILEALYILYALIRPRVVVGL